MIGTTEFTVKATLSGDGGVSAKVVATCPYGQRSATVDSPVTDEQVLAGIEKAMKKAVAGDLREDLNQQATAAAAEAVVVATRKGEKI